MTVANQFPYQSYTADGTQSEFVLSFYVEDKQNISVKRNGVLVSTNDYTYTAANAIKFNTTPISGEVIEIERNTITERSINYSTYNNSFRPETLNYDLDRVWRKLQELGVVDWVLDHKISDLKDYVDTQGNELKNTLLAEIQAQGVSLDQLGEYYNYLTLRLAQIAVDKSWDASFVVDGTQTQKQINDLNLYAVASVSDLRALTPIKKGQKVFLESYFLNERIGSGQLIATQKLGLVDNGVTVFASPNPLLFWVRTDITLITPEMGGAKLNNASYATQNTTAFVNIFNVARDIPIKFQTGTYYIDGEIPVYGSTTALGNFTQLSSKGTIIRFTTASAKFKFYNALGTIFKNMMLYHESDLGTHFEWDSATAHNYNYFDNVYIYGGKTGYNVTRALYPRWFRCRTVTSATASGSSGIFLNGTIDAQKIDAPEILQCSFSCNGAPNSTCIKVDGAVHSLKMNNYALLFASYGLRVLNSANTSIFPKFIYTADGGTENCLVGMSFEAGSNIKLSNIYSSNTTTDITNAAIQTDAAFYGELSIVNAEITGSYQVGARFLGGNIRLSNSWVGNNGRSTVAGVGIRLGDVTSAIITNNRIGNKTIEPGGAYQNYGVQFSFTTSKGLGILISNNDMRENLSASFNDLSTAPQAKILNNYTKESLDSALTLIEGGSTTIDLTVRRYLFNNPALTAYTLVLPTNPIDGQTVECTFQNPITTLTLSSSITINSGISTLAITAMKTIRFHYRSGSTRWYILQ